MYDVTKFIEFALSHAKRASVPEGAKLLVPLNKVALPVNGNTSLALLALFALSQNSTRSGAHITSLMVGRWLTIRQLLRIGWPKSVLCVTVRVCATIFLKMTPTLKATTLDIAPPKVPLRLLHANTLLAKRSLRVLLPAPLPM